MVKQITVHERDLRRRLYTALGIMAIPVIAGFGEGICKANGIELDGATNAALAYGPQTLAAAYGTVYGGAFAIMPRGPAADKKDKLESILLGLTGGVMGGVACGGVAWGIKEASKYFTYTILNMF